MPGKVVVGAQWGDEGKGKFIDIFASEADVVVRTQGGNNAGHTVITGGEKFALHLVPSGILYPDTINVVGPGVVVDPKYMLGEMESLSSRGVSLKGLRIDARAHVIMPWHIELDGMSEKARGGKDIGTTKRGIGPCYMDKDERCGLRMHELIDPEVFPERCREVCAMKNAILTKLYGEAPLDAEAIVAEYTEIGAKLREYVCDTTIIVYDAIKADKYVLFEGAQGMLLDIDLGTYPYVTSSHPTAGGAVIGSGVGPTAIDDCIGVLKSYTTRVGKGPFPTELIGGLGDVICQKGGEFGVTTGRKRRCGWFDVVIARYAVRVNGLTSIIINKLDPLSDLGDLQLCTGYELDGKIVTEFPADLKTLARCKPVYKTMKGFGDITKAKTYAELPKEARDYIETIESLVGCPVKYVGNGPDRSDIIEK